MSLSPKTQHTPLPWEIIMDADKEGDVYIYGPDGNKEIIYSPGELLGISQADAAFIVRAVNAHEELLEWVKFKHRCCDLESKDCGTCQLITKASAPSEVSK